jgi:hypothetical protein
MMGNQRRPEQAKPNQPKEQKVKSPEFFKPFLATTPLKENVHHYV